MTTKKLRSRRADGRGHWPAGRRRHATTKREVDRALGRAARVIQRASWAGASWRALARYLGVSPQAVQHWRRGHKRPSRETVRAIQRWCERWPRRSLYRNRYA